MYGCVRYVCMWVCVWVGGCGWVDVCRWVCVCTIVANRWGLFILDPTNTLVQQ